MCVPTVSSLATKAKKSAFKLRLLITNRRESLLQKVLRV